MDLKEGDFLKYDHYNTNQLYFTPRLIKALDAIVEYPFTMLEAPMGYGKTTTIKYYFQNKDSDMHWLKVYDSLIVHFWEALAMFFGEFKDGLYENLINLGMPEINRLIGALINYEVTHKRLYHRAGDRYFKVQDYFMA